jgi:hypothetical protein
MKIRLPRLWPSRPQAGEGPPSEASPRHNQRLAGDDGDTRRDREQVSAQMAEYRQRRDDDERQIKEQQFTQLEARYGLADAWPRLSESLDGPRHPHACQSCGVERPHNAPGGATGAVEGLEDIGEPGWDEETTRLMESALKPSPGVYGWQEHDSRDEPEPIAVMLCTRCSARLINPHPRLYNRIPPNAPFAGIMELCVDCRFRDGVRCTHPDLKANGGTGLVVDADQGARAHVNLGGGRGAFLTIYREPPRACVGRRESTYANPP